MSAEQEDTAAGFTARVRELVTLVIPLILEAEAGATQEELDPMARVVTFLGLDANSDADLALMASSVEIARWVIVSAEIQGVDAAALWAKHVQGPRHG